MPLLVKGWDDVLLEHGNILFELRLPSNNMGLNANPSVPTRPNDIAFPGNLDLAMSSLLAAR